MTSSSIRARVLNIANWYPNPWNSVEGNFIRDHIALFSEICDSDTVVVQVRYDKKAWLRLKKIDLDDGALAIYCISRLRSGKMIEIISTALLIYVLFQKRAWKFDVLHFHIAYPLLSYSRFWKRLFGRPIIISEHWSAYHYNFHLPPKSKHLRSIRAAFTQHFPVLAVSRSLLSDIQKFSGRHDFPGYIVPNVVPLHGANGSRNSVPVFFSVSRWVKIKDPMPMLEGFDLAAKAGAQFKLVLGGFGELMTEMQSFVSGSALLGRTRFLGRMTKPAIAAQLAQTDGYVFSSRYETFSIACAEALGAGVPLIGPYIPAIAEYAGDDDWERVAAGDPSGWRDAVIKFLDRHKSTDFNRNQIALRAENRFSHQILRAQYMSILEKSLRA